MLSGGVDFDDVALVGQGCANSTELAAIRGLRGEMGNVSLCKRYKMAEGPR